MEIEKPIVKHSEINIPLVNDISNERRENESFSQYKDRVRKQNLMLKMRKKAIVFLPNDINLKWKQ